MKIKKFLGDIEFKRDALNKDIENLDYLESVINCLDDEYKTSKNDLDCLDSDISTLEESIKSLLTSGEFWDFLYVDRKNIYDSLVNDLMDLESDIQTLKDKITHLMEFIDNENNK